MLARILLVLFVLWMPFVGKTWPHVPGIPEFPPCDCTPEDDECVC